MNARHLRRLIVGPDTTDPRLTTAERIALDVRAQVALTGRCPCGAEMRLPENLRDGVFFVPVEHEHDCPAVSAAAECALRKLARGAA